MTWKTSIGFVVLASLVIIVTGYLTSVDLLPIRETIQFKDGGVQFISLWMNLAITLGIIMPAIAFAVGFKRFKLRRIFGFYFLLLGIQIVTEQILSKGWMPSLVVPTGTLYTAFRVWQLWQGLQITQSTRKQPLRYKLLRGALGILFCFWLSNLIMLLTLVWPTLL